MTGSPVSAGLARVSCVPVERERAGRTLERAQYTTAPRATGSQQLSAPGAAGIIWVTIVGIRLRIVFYQ